MRITILILLALIIHCNLQSQTRSEMNSIAGKVFFKEVSEDTYTLRSIFNNSDSTHSENPRMVAIALNVTLGLLGMHRLYLGTDLKVPIIYTFTFGGGGVLWLVDLGLLIFTPDISRYMNNPRVFMWTGK